MCFKLHRGLNLTLVASPLDPHFLLSAYTRTATKKRRHEHHKTSPTVLEYQLSSRSPKGTRKSSYHFRPVPCTCAPVMMGHSRGRRSKREKENQARRCRADLTRLNACVPGSARVFVRVLCARIQLSFALCAHALRFSLCETVGLNIFSHFPSRFSPVIIHMTDFFRGGE